MDLKKTLRLLSPQIVEGVLSVRKNSTNRLVERLHELEFATKRISIGPDKVEIELQILDNDLLYQLLAGEANRFLLASRVSYVRSTQNQPNNASWQAIENYYAAYYGIHYLLRLTGISLTNIEAQGVAAIERSKFGSKPIDTAPGGLYIIKYDDESKLLTLTKNKKKTGGSHYDAWRLWEHLLGRLIIETDTDPIEYARTHTDLTDHRRFLIRSTAKYNPSEIRGEINYQFKGGSWIFENG